VLRNTPSVNLIFAKRVQKIREISGLFLKMRGIFNFLSIRKVEEEIMKLTPLQMQEINQAKKSGLSEESISFLSTGQFNFKKMEELRFAMESGISLEEIKKRKRPRFFLKKDKENIFYYESKLSQMQRMLLILLILSMTAFALIVFQGENQDEIILNLYQDEVTLSCFQKFQPENYIKEIQQTEQAILTLPKSIDTSYPCTYVKKYVLELAGKRIEKFLRVKVIDDEAPNLELFQKEISVIDRDSFSCRAYIKTAYDKVEGDIKNKVYCSSELSEEENQIVSYFIEDSSGNRFSTDLKVHLFQAEQILQEEMEESY